MNMFLSKEEERILERGDGYSKCMEILVALGEIYGAEKLIPIKHAHISGISYQNIGDEGLEWLKSLNVKFSVKATLNPAGMDLERWKDMNLDEEFVKKQMEVLKVFELMGAEITLTCTPYYIYKPSKGENVAWSESSAVVYANSVLGARTNRESGISALASAVIGKTPYYGLHIKENRAPDVLIDVRCDCDVALLGRYVGEIVDGIPVFKFRRKLKECELKALGASLASTGSIAMFHVIGQTPEWKDFDLPKEKIVIDDIKDLDSYCEPDLIALGCPHLSKNELLELYEIVRKYEGKSKIEFWVFTSRKVYNEMADVIKFLEGKGIKVFRDTCMVVSPATEKFKCVMANSGKALTYLPKLRKVRAVYGDIHTCVSKAFKQ